MAYNNVNYNHLNYPLGIKQHKRGYSCIPSFLESYNLNGSLKRDIIAQNLPVCINATLKFPSLLTQSALNHSLTCTQARYKWRFECYSKQTDHYIRSAILALLPVNFNLSSYLSTAFNRYKLNWTTKLDPDVRKTH